MKKRINRVAFRLIAICMVFAALDDTRAENPNALGSSYARTDAATSTRRASGPPFTLECASIAMGSGVLSDGSIGVIGQAVVGTISNADFTIEVGIVPCLVPTTGAIVTPDPLEPADDGLGGDYNRVGDFKMPASAGGQEVAIRVKLDRMYIDSDEDPTNGCPVRKENKCSHNDSIDCTDDAGCQPGGACEPSCNAAAFCIAVLGSLEGQVRYLGPPAAFSNNATSAPKWVGAKLQCTPLVRDWSPGALAAALGGGVDTDTIYYYGAEVVPCSIYDVRQGDQGCVNSGNENCLSDSLEVRTALWGDLWPEFGLVNFSDINAEVNAFKGIAFTAADPDAEPNPLPPSGGPNKWRAMLRDNEGAPVDPINFGDIGKTVDGFKQIFYREKGPSTCP